ICSVEVPGKTEETKVEHSSDLVKKDCRWKGRKGKEVFIGVKVDEKLKRSNIHWIEKNFETRARVDDTHATGGEVSKWD
ncbi:hypothetical protein A2U01_0075359, partial [Trifolium medium]|nr:hypothetical protein [Trifolium medium]